MKRFIVVAILVVCAVAAFAVKSAASTPADPAYLVNVGGIYEVSFCTGGRVVSGYSDGYPIHVKVTGMLGDGWIEAEWAESLKNGPSGKELLTYRPHAQQRFNLNAACAISQQIK